MLRLKIILIIALLSLSSLLVFASFRPIPLSVYTFTQNAWRKTMGYQLPVAQTRTQTETTSQSSALATTTPKTATTTPTTSKSTKKVKQITIKNSTVATSTPTIPLKPASTTPPDLNAVNTSARLALVNILCTTQTAGTLYPITASGVIIDSRGVILTNAHVAEYWLLENFSAQNFVECTIRTGSPAYPRYKAELVYVSPTWVQANKGILKQTDPKGTGENDFALLHITESTDGTPLPSVFPFIPPNTREDIDRGEYTALVSYPAGFLGGISILKDLYLTSAITKIADIFTFKADTVDLISVPGTVISQKGASGGGVFDARGTLIGIISTSSDGDTTDTRDLRAITLAYISRALKTETGKDLSQFLATDIATVAHNFQKSWAPTLTKLITDELTKN